jgi:carbon storage regulator
VGAFVLVLRRRVGESIAIGSDIEIEVIEISRTRVKLGIRAPRSIAVIRRESIPVAAENRSASEFIGSRGAQDMAEILRILRKLPAGPDIKSGGTADKYAEDTAGISKESREPGPGMTTGMYQAKDADNV